MRKQSFWNVDIRLLLRMWWLDISTFAMTALAFLGMGLPVIIPTLVLWYLFSIDFQMPK